MTIYNFYLFDRKGTCLHYAEWTRNRHASMSQDEEFKLMYGMLYSVKSFVTRISPKPVKDGLYYYKTSAYKLNFYETASGLKFVLNTDPNVGDIRDVLQQIHSQIYVETLVKNPVYKLGDPIDSELFKSKLNAFVTALPYFT
eukprot:Opistho-2@38288